MGFPSMSKPILATCLSIAVSAGVVVLGGVVDVVRLLDQPQGFEWKGVYIDADFRAVELAGLQGRTCPELDRVQIVVFAADHGVAEEGVSAFPQAVTVEMIRNFARGGAAISVAARRLGADLEVVDVGAVHDVGPLESCKTAGAPGIAVWRRDDFRSRRFALLYRLMEMRGRRTA